jgi:mRNA interferase MazF
VVARGEIYWADLGAEGGRRRVVVLTRDAAIEVRRRVTCAPLTRTRRGIDTEVPVGRREGVDNGSVISCDNVVTIPKAALDPTVLGALGPVKRVALDRALRYALDIAY